MGEGYRLTGYASAKKYKVRDTALDACLAMSKCLGVTKEGIKNYRLNTGSVLSVESSMTAYLAGGELVSFKEYTMTYASYSWKYQSPFTLTGSYQDNTTYKTRNSALQACAATDKCLGVTKESKKNYRLYTSGTTKYSKSRSVWIQGGKIVKESGYNWAAHPKMQLSGYTSTKVYKTRSAALKACAAGAGCKGVTKEGDNNYRLNSGSTLKPSTVAKAYLKSGKLVIANDYYWTKVAGYNFKKHIPKTKYKKLSKAKAVCTAKVSVCVGISQTKAGAYYLAIVPDMKNVAGGYVHVLGSTYEKEWFFVYAGQ